MNKVFYSVDTGYDRFSFEYDPNENHSQEEMAHLCARDFYFVQCGAWYEWDNFETVEFHVYLSENGPEVFKKKIKMVLKPEFINV